MSTPLLVFATGAAPAFALGWYLRGWWERTKGDPMDRPHSRLAPIDRLFAWFSEGNRLVAYTLAVGLIGVGAMIYTWNADQQSEDRTDQVIACVGEYVDALSSAQVPRTEASVLASDARYAWDVAPPGPEKDRLLVAYQKAYRHYVEVRTGNPIPRFNRAFCQEAAASD